MGAQLQASGYAARYSCRNSSSADGAAGDKNADRAGPPSGGLNFKTSLGVCVNTQ
jgi:hypothetical protein